MRTYPTDSPEAAARIVALTLVSDGRVTKQEIETLDRIDAYAALGIDRAGMQAVLQALCEDLLADRLTDARGACEIDPRTLQSLMTELQSPPLRATVLRLCAVVAEADGHIADGESIVLVQAVEQWGLQAQMLAPEPSAREA